MQQQKTQNCKQATTFCLPRTLKFAWLIRQDVRNGRDIDDIEAQKDFVLWWMLYGEKEYAETDPLPNSIKASLFKPLENYPQQGYFGIGRLLQHIYKLRTDIQEHYDIKTLEGVIAFNQWFYLYGIKEHKLSHQLSTEIIDALNKPVTNFLNPKENSELPKLSVLMFFVWSVREDIHTVFDLNTNEGRNQFLGWFFIHGVPDLGLKSILNFYWLDWLNENIALDKTIFLPRIAQLFWFFRDDVNKAFDLNTKKGQLSLANWTHQVLKTEPYQWINQLTEEKTKLLGVNLIGFAFGELGIGEDVRMAAAACESAGIPYTVINISPGKTVRQNDKILADSITDYVNQLTYQTNIFCLTGFDTVHVYLEKGRQLFENRYNIGWWPWELPVWPEHWNNAFDLIDEVWAATTYTQTMYQQATNKPVSLMPLAVSIDRVVPASREEFGLPDNKFLFLYTFDFNSYLDRKNPHAVVKAFIQAFSKDNTDVGLVLKTMNSDPENPKWKAFQQLCKKDNRIILLEKTLDREKVLALINICDAYISLHRAEGFGRTPAEAMLLGKPVITTDFSGNTDFVNQKTGFPVKWKKKKVKVGEYPFITEKSKAYWAEPNIVHAAEQMQAALKSTDNKVVSQQIKQFALQKFSVSRIGKLMKQRLIEVK
jgi:glycosyltransferase involved in cell wall biosynthesis